MICDSADNNKKGLALGSFRNTANGYSKLMSGL